MAGNAAPNPDDHIDDHIDDPGGDADAGYAAALAHLNGLLLDAGSLESVLQGVVDGVRIAVPQLAAVSVTTVDEDGRYTTAAASDPRAREIDEIEYELELGPCVEALETGEEQFVDDIETDLRWHPFNEAMRRLGFASAAGIPLRTNEVTYGALNLFADRPFGIDPDTREITHRLAPMLAATLANARAYLTTDRLSSQLQQRLHDIAVLQQAVGILMAERRCDAVTATTWLHEAATTAGRPVDEVAEQIVAAVTERGGAGATG